MTREELNALLVTRTGEGLGANDPRYVIPIVDGCLHGLAVSAVPPELVSNIPREQRGSMVIVDDRDPATSGPDSFDSDTMELVLAVASQVAIDSAEPCEKLYQYFMELVSNGKKLLIVQTTPERHGMWREFFRFRWKGAQIAEVVPVRDDPDRVADAFVTRFDEGG
ncbi:MAG TPA: hypothetical protein VEU96_16270 [Bryobacteraceae bacterium]|nr:hypothetical protein [Bryobacteraceae bacterium]